VQDRSDGPLASLLIAKQIQFRWVNSSNTLSAVTNKNVEKKQSEKNTNGIRVEERETARASWGTEARVEGGIVLQISVP